MIRIIKDSAETSKRRQSMFEKIMYPASARLTSKVFYYGDLILDSEWIDKAIKAADRSNLCFVEKQEKHLHLIINATAGYNYTLLGIEFGEQDNRIHELMSTFYIGKCGFILEIEMKKDPTLKKDGLLSALRRTKKHPLNEKTILFIAYSNNKEYEKFLKSPGIGKEYTDQNCLATSLWQMDDFVVFDTGNDKRTITILILFK